jgi:hypothetical protein
MKSFLNALLGIVAFAGAFAQTAAPNVAQLRAKYAADIKALDTARAAAISRIQNSYLQELAAGERNASATGKVSEVAALLKVREAVASNSLDLAPHPDMTKAQAKRHADFHASLAAIDRDFAPRYARLNGDCLRTLASMESRLPANSPVRAEIDRFKATVISGASGGGALVEKLIGTKWQWWESQTIEFNDAGKGTFREGNTAIPFRWRVAPDGKVLYSREDQRRTTFTFEFEDERIKIINPQGQSWKGRFLGKPK